MARNILALTAVRDFIKKNPEKHDQSTWGQLGQPYRGIEDVQVTCGTAACVAGWAAALAGARFPVRYGQVELNYMLDPRGEEWWVRDYAKAVLGLSDEEARTLFRTSNSHEETLKLLKRLIKGKDI